MNLKLSVEGHHKTLLGYVAGIVTGVTYGLNPLFAVPLMKDGVSVDSILFFRYFLAVIILGIWLVFRRESFRLSLHQARQLVILGLFFSLSSFGLFEAYKYIPSGIATTIVFLYPVLVAIIMMFLKVYPTWQVWRHFCRRAVPERRRWRPNAAVARSGSGIHVGFSLLDVHCDCEQEQVGASHIELDADVLRASDRSHRFLRLCRRGTYSAVRQHSWHIVMGQPRRSGCASDNSFHSDPGHVHKANRCHQGVRSRSI